MLSLSLYLCRLETEEDRDKLERIYIDYMKPMSDIAKRFVARYQADEDVVHNAILKIIKHLEKLDLSQFEMTKSFVCIVTKSCAIDWLRHRYPKDFTVVSYDDLPVELDSDEDLPIDYIMTEEGYNKILKCIESLYESYRDVCYLKFVYKMKEDKIAELLNLTPKNVSVRIFRGRKKLAKMLKEEGYNVKEYSR